MEDKGGGDSKFRNASEWYARRRKNRTPREIHDELDNNLSRFTNVFVFHFKVDQRAKSA